MEKSKTKLLHAPRLDRQALSAAYPPVECSGPGHKRLCASPAVGIAAVGSTEHVGIRSCLVCMAGSTEHG